MGICRTPQRDGLPVRPRDGQIAGQRAGACGRIDRRTVLKASVGLAAAVLVPPRRAVAVRQSAGGYVAAEWVEAEQVGYPEAQVAGFDDVEAQPLAFQTPFSFAAVAPHWSGEEGPGATVELSLSADGVGWTDPLLVGEDPDGGRPDRDGRRFGRMVAYPGSFVRYRTFDATGTPAPLLGFTWSYFDAPAGPGPGYVEAAQPAEAPGFGPPPIITRAAWGADESLRFRNGAEVWPVEYRLPEHVVVHHSDTMNFEDPTLGIRLIYYFHAVTRGWGDIGYNYVVDFLGNVYEGRVGGENAIGGHALQFNPGTAGICTMGRFFAEPITPEMRVGLTWIVAWAARNLDPVGSAPLLDIPNLPTICGHRDVNPTSCPGDALYDDVVRLREDVRRLQSGELAPGGPDPRFVAGEVVAVKNDGARLRDGPDTDFSVITPLPLGEVLVISDGPVTNDNRIWYAVRGSSLGGWVAADALRRAPELPPPAPAAPEPAPDPDAVAGNAPPAAAAPPSDSAPVEGAAAEGQPPAAAPADAASDAAVAAPVPADGATAPSSSPPVAAGAIGAGQDGTAPQGFAAPAIGPGATVQVAGGPLNLRDGAGYGAGVVAELPDGSWVTIVDGPAEVDGALWYFVDLGDGRSGWCSGAYLVPV